MLREIGVGVLVVLAIGVAAPSTDARSFTDGELRLAVVTASAHWPWSRCHGLEKVWWTTPDEMARIAQPGSTGTVNYGECAAIIDPSLTRSTTELCTALAHEFGHLAGLGHSEEGVMAPVLTRFTTPCLRAFPRPSSRLPRVRWGQKLRRRYTPSGMSTTPKRSSSA